MEIRTITPADDRMALSRVYEESWKHAYKGMIPQSYLDSIPKGRWAKNADDPRWHTLLCVDNGEIVGTSSFCRSRFEAYPDWGEIVSIYLLPGHIGKGCGKALMSAAITELRTLGYADIFLWVLEENTRARRFYEHFGFEQTDAFLLDTIGGKELREIRYVYKKVDAPF